MGFSLTVPRFGMSPMPNFARAFLFRATDALNRGDKIAAGALLREAIRRQCWAECDWFGCLPANASEKTPPIELAKALKKAGHCGRDDYGFDSVKEMIGIANKAVHLAPVKASYLSSSISLMHGMIDACPCLQPANMAGALTEPECCCDDDDDDAGEAWKAGVA